MKRWLISIAGKCRLIAALHVAMVTSCLFVASPGSAREWYEGGTLHKARAAQWHRATERNRLARSADFVAAAKAASNMRELRERAEAVEACVSEATVDESSREMLVSEVAAACLILLGYK